MEFPGIPNPFNGKLIVFEGIDGSSKTSQLETAEQNMCKSIAENHQKNIQVIKKFKEPQGKSFWGNRIYQELAKPHGLHESNPKLFQSWYAVDSVYQMPEIERFMECGCHIFMDRYRSSMVYGAKTKKDLSELMKMNQIILGKNFIWPDLILIFDISPETAIQRLTARGRAFDEHEKLVTLSRVRNNYLMFANTYANCQIINSEQEPEEVSKDVISAINTVL
ncbi:MAG: hypothetical protein AAB784_01720 [Patescibacteria group bacterium]